MLHRFEHTIVAPLGALCVALALTQLADASAAAGRHGLRIAGLALAWGALPAFLANSGWRVAGHRTGHEDSPALRAYARAIEAAAEPDAVVVTPEESMMPVYYSRRHLWRAVADDAALRLSLPDLRRRFPCAPLYLALRPGRTGGFEGSLRRHRAVHRSADLLFLELEPRGADDPRGCAAPGRPAAQEESG
jgi:hypothetical protein